MKIFIAGGTGRVASALIQNLVADGHEVIAGARHPENVVLRENELVTAVKLDLQADMNDIAEVIGQVDVVYFTAGSRGQDLLQTDAFGAVKTMQAAEKNGIKRYIMLSSLHALEPDKWHEGGLANIMDYNVAKFFADNYLVNQTTLDYTILQPATLTETTGTGKISIGKLSATTNPIADVAAVLATLPTYDQTIKRVIEMASGGESIDTALAQVK
ncbi:oxidoreductase [Furfurilactobacillus curtus]|uniref:Oxidoreductase n=2 Tax=Furfurilactobacillus curtus TaxID=1746200 RepID=A0ABQ5JRK4_9LACO